MLLLIAIKRSDSVRSRRKVSAVSERSDTSEHLEQEVSGHDGHKKSEMVTYPQFSMYLLKV